MLHFLILIGNVFENISYQNLKTQHEIILSEKNSNACFHEDRSGRLTADMHAHGAETHTLFRWRLSTS